jgi:dihydrofolate reductase
MKTILIFVSSLDGKITKWGNPDVRSWSSRSDQEYFDSVWGNTRVILMGRASYEARPVSPGTKHIFIVMTRQPEKFKDREAPGQLEFTDHPPLSLVQRFEDEGEERMLILGGPEIATLFLKENLVNELWLTLEPKIFGQGGNFVKDERLDIELELLSCNRLNEQGTQVMKYRILKPWPQK